MVATNNYDVYHAAPTSLNLINNALLRVSSLIHHSDKDDHISNC